MGGFRAGRVRKDVEHENHPNVGGFRAQSVRKGVEHENTPILGVFSCWVCVEGVEHESTPTKGGFHARHVRKGVEHGNTPRIVMDTGMAPRDGSQVRGPAGRGRVRRFFPVTFPYPFVRVTGL